MFVFSPSFIPLQISGIRNCNCSKSEKRAQVPAMQGTNCGLGKPCRIDEGDDKSWPGCSRCPDGMFPGGDENLECIPCNTRRAFFVQALLVGGAFCLVAIIYAMVSKQNTAGQVARFSNAFLLASLAGSFRRCIYDRGRGSVCVYGRTHT